MAAVGCPGCGQTRFSAGLAVYVWTDADWYSEPVACLPDDHAAVHGALQFGQRPAGAGTSASPGRQAVGRHARMGNPVAVPAGLGDRRDRDAITDEGPRGE